MGDLTQLITALAALITSLGGAVAAVIVAIRSGNRQAEAASRSSAALTDADQDGEKSPLDALKGLDPEEAEAVAQLLQRRNKSGGRS